MCVVVCYFFFVLLNFDKTISKGFIYVHFTKRQIDGAGKTRSTNSQKQKQRRGNCENNIVLRSVYLHRVSHSLVVDSVAIGGSFPESFRFAHGQDTHTRTRTRTHTHTRTFIETHTTPSCAAVKSQNHRKTMAHPTHTPLPSCSQVLVTISSYLFVPFNSAIFCCFVSFTTLISLSLSFSFLFRFFFCFQYFV